ncbi:FCD domain-containing protein, partial [Nonomuraea lactucae]|uniref:FCD domain-containing protein n=1 Tax=Nonomuraea lactucae TaxID=2249762 RepID=UPI000DE50721
AGADLVLSLRGLLGELETAGDAARGALDGRFWDLVVDGSGNICYRLSLNALRQAYRPAEPMVTSVLAAEHRAVEDYRAVVTAIAGRDAASAAQAAATLLARGTSAMHALLAMEEPP